MNGEPCPRCIFAAERNVITVMGIHPVPTSAPPLSQRDNTPCCKLCAAADGMTRFDDKLTWDMARVAVHSEWEELARLPGSPSRIATMFPVEAGVLAEHDKWLESHGAFEYSVEVEKFYRHCLAPVSRSWKAVIDMRKSLGQDVSRLQSIHPPSCVCGGKGYTVEEYPIQGAPLIFTRQNLCQT